MLESLIEKPATPEGYITKKDGIWGEWTVFLDDEFGTVLAYDFPTKEAAVAFIIEHKKQNS